MEELPFIMEHCELSSFQEVLEEKLLWMNSFVDLFATVIVFRVACTYFISDRNKTNVSNKYESRVSVTLFKISLFLKNSQEK